MRGNMMIFALLCLFLFWMLPADFSQISDNFSKRDIKGPIQLSMSEDAIDDIFSDCKEKMAKLVKDKFFKKENTGDFKYFWNATDKNEILKTNINGDEALTKEHKKAIILYTFMGGVYEKLNKAVRSGKESYGTSFKFHSFYFWLTSAIQILNKKQLNKKTQCVTIYRRDEVVYNGNVDQKIRFGSFTSGSKIPNLTNFGKKTCFKIRTCLGAYVNDYSLHTNEEEVIIPPYEIFIITQKKQDKSVEGLTDCELVYVLETAGFKTNLDCKLFKKQ